MTNNQIIHLTDQNFESTIIQTKKMILVDFWAEWCGPCKMLAPILDIIAKDYNEKLVVAKINIDDNPETPKKYNVRGIPTLILFNNAETVATKVGALSQLQIKEFIDIHI